MDSSKCLTSTHLLTLVRWHFAPWFPFSLSVGYLVSVNDIHQWPVIIRWTTMFNLDTSIHIVGHVIVAGLCRRPSKLVAFHICYLLDRASVHEISTPVTWFQCMSDIFSHHYGDLDPLYIFILHGDHDPLYIFIMEILICLYCTWRWPHMSHFVYHAYSWPLYSYVSDTAICICSHVQSLIIVFYCWMAGSSTWFFITPLIGWTCIVFWPSYHPSDLTH